MASYSADYGANGSPIFLLSEKGRNWRDDRKGRVKEEREGGTPHGLSCHKLLVKKIGRPLLKEITLPLETRLKTRTEDRRRVKGMRQGATGCETSKPSFFEERGRFKRTRAGSARAREKKTRHM